MTHVGSSTKRQPDLHLLSENIKLAQSDCDAKRLRRDKIKKQLAAVNLERRDISWRLDQLPGDVFRRADDLSDESAIELTAGKAGPLIVRLAALDFLIERTQQELDGARDALRRAEETLASYIEFRRQLTTPRVPPRWRRVVNKRRGVNAATQ